MYLNAKGVNIDNDLFDLKFNSPQNFAAYRQSEMDNARVNTFASLQEVPYMSKRFALKRFLGLSAEEMAENETLCGVKKMLLVHSAIKIHKYK